MTVVPLPASPCVRVRLIYSSPTGGEAGSRFYLSYSGSAPSSGNCGTLAADISGAWNSALASMVPNEWALIETDVIDIATHTGASGSNSTSHAGTRTGTEIPENCATNIEFDISRRYRGGKPRIFMPPGVAGDTDGASHWTSGFITGYNSAFNSFMSAVEAFSIGSMGTLTHVNLSYYSGFTNHTNTSGRSRPVPTYRDTAVVDTVEGYSTKGLIGSQRRRRTSTTP